MKNYLAIALAVIALGFSAGSIAGDRDRYDRHDRDRYYYRDHDRDWKYDRRNYRHYYDRKYDRRPYYSKHYYSKHRYDKHHYRGHGRGNKVIIHKHYRDGDDVYKWIGGVYLLNEILHHDHHRH